MKYKPPRMVAILFMTIFYRPEGHSSLAPPLDPLAKVEVNVVTPDTPHVSSDLSPILTASYNFPARNLLVIHPTLV